MRPDTSGFTLLEILVVLVLVSVLCTLSLTHSLGMLQKKALSTHVASLRSLLLTARSHALTGTDNASWGVCFADGFVLFKAPYTSPQPATIPAPAIETTLPNCEAPDMLVFTKDSGTTSPRSITLSTGSQSDALYISYEGSIK